MSLERVNPATPCQQGGAHHPHRWNCFEMDGCDWWDDFHQIGVLVCCVCGHDWPCPTKQAHAAARKEKT